MDDSADEMTADERAWLDSLDADDRAKAIAWLANRLATGRDIAARLDNVTDTMLAVGFKGPGAVELMTSAALGAEAMRAIGRGDHDRAMELFDAGRLGPLPDFTVVIRPRTGTTSE